MAKPILTPEEIENLKRERKKLQDTIDSFTASIPIKNEQLVEAQSVDGAMKKFFDYYNSSIIGAYDTELRNINGRYYLDAPITEQDLIYAITGENIKLDPSTTRVLTPEYPDTDIVRIPEFDGGNTGFENDGEMYNLNNIRSTLNALQNGYPNNGADGSILASISPSSTSVDFSIPIGPPPDTGSEYVIRSSSDYAVVKVTSVTFNPPTLFGTMQFTYTIPPSGTIPSGNNLMSFDGFNNSERSSKTASNSLFQVVMLGLLSELDKYFSNLSFNLGMELSSILNNEDEFAVTELAVAESNVISFQSIVDSYRISYDISNSGISGILSNITSRDLEISTRISQIMDAYTTRPENFYDERYKYANHRSNTLTGTLAKVISLQKSIPSIMLMIAQSQAAIDAIDELLS